MLARYVSSSIETPSQARHALQLQADTGAQYDHLVYLRVFEGCNLVCDHCFIPHNPKRLTHEDVAKVPSYIRKFAQPGARILIQWHGGEPTVFGEAWIRKAIRYLIDGGPEFTWLYGLQTNLINYTSEWGRLYHDYFRGQVGVSWDPGIRHYRGSNEQYEKIFWKNLTSLIQDGIRPYLVVTGTRPFFERYEPFRFFQLLEEAGIQYVHIERLTPTGSARINWPTLGMSNAQFSAYMTRYARAYVLYKANCPDGVNVSPFDGLMESVRSLRAGDGRGYGCWSGDCDSRFHTVDADGYKPGCTAITAETLLIPIMETRNVRTRLCTQCRYRPICSSGCMTLPVEDGSGECSGAKSLFETVEFIVSQEEGGL